MNNGSITVVARANNPGTATVVGVQTQSGDDTVINNGLISATTENLAGVVLSSGIGIDTGAGNDTVQLGDGSLVVGTVSLGDDDDTLWLSGSAAIENYLGELLNPDGGAGNDHLVLSGIGDFFAVPASFERATKRDAGTFWLNELPTVNALTIDGGTLELGTDYSFAQDGIFNTFIHSNGDRGELLVNGVATIDGSIDVERRGDDFIDDGTRYSVVNSSDPLLGEFSSVTLPDALPLLSFAFERLDNSVDVVAVAASFQTVADSSLQMAVASNLDQLAPLSAGDFREQLGSIQSMESGFGSALDGLSPDSNLVLTTNTIAIAHQTTQLLRTHLGNARAVLRGTRSEAAAYSPVALYYDGVQMAATDASESRAYAGGPSNTSKRVASESRAETWLMAFGGSGDIDLIDGYTDYDQDMAGFAAGADYLFGNNFIAGFSLDIAESKLKMQKAVAKTDIESWGGSLYATAFWENSYVEGGISFGRQDFSSRRTLSIDGVTSDIVSKHDGNSTMAFLGAGRAFTFSDWTVEPYATLYYFGVSEDGFAEEGAGSLNQLVQKKSANTLLGEVGTTFSLLRPAGNGFLDWHTTLAYNHDFDIDTSSISYAYEGAPTTLFSIAGRNVVSGSAVIGMGLAYQNGRSILSLDYRGQFNGDYEQHILGARLVYMFR
jgi:outer membrane autotransporter protein